MPVVINFYLHVYSSRTDNAGCQRWAFTLIEAETMREINGLIDGGESNADSIRFGFSQPGEWDRGIMRLATSELGIREFNRMTKGWPVAGCRAEQLQHFIREKLKEPA